MTFHNSPPDRSNSSTSNSTAASLRKLLSLARPHKGLFVVGLIALLVGSGINLLFPEMVRRLLKPELLEYVVANQTTIVLGIAALFLIQGAAFFVRSYLFGLLGQRVYADLRQKLFKSVLQKEISFFDRQRSSDLASRINSDAALIQDAVSVKLSVIVRYGIQVICGIVLMLAMSWKLTLAIVFSVGAIVSVSLFFVRFLKQASRGYQTELARLTSFASECFSGMKIIRALGAGDEVVAGASEYNEATRKAGEQRVWWSASFSSGASALLNILLLCVAWYGLTLVGYGSLPFNELAAFILYGAIVAVSFSFLVGAYAELMQGLGGLERVFELMEDEAGAAYDDEPFSTRQRQRALAQRAESVGVTYSDVSFCYPDRPDRVVLEDFTCVIQPGSVSAFVGPSGSGKSTVTQLLCNLYRPDAGRITLQIGNESVRLDELREESLRSLIAWVPQEPQLFGFSIIENLMLGDPGLERDEVLKRIHSWEFLDFIEPLEAGVDTVLGEHGTLLSGGQRQRLAIARALLRKPALLILDEATSGLDSESEAHVMKAIRQHIPHATLLVISHRLATVSSADTIYVLHDGKVVQEGTHLHLSKTPGIYRQYSERQALLA
jgi:ABC-type multidrug transport system fused ATPase/permease subunit